MKQVLFLLCVSMSSGSFAAAPFPPGSATAKDFREEEVTMPQPGLPQERPVFISLTDEEGQVISIANPNAPVNTDDLEPGTYQVHYQFENGLVADRRIIVY